MLSGGVLRYRWGCPRAKRRFGEFHGKFEGETRERNFVREAQRRVEELRAVIGDEEVSTNNPAAYARVCFVLTCRLASGAGALR